MKKMTITTLFAAGAMLLGCNDKELLNPNVAFPAFSIIDGDTVKTRDDKAIKDRLKGHPENFKMISTGDTVMTYKSPKKTKPAKVANLINITNPDRKGKKFRLVTFGGSLAAGARDGGLFNEGMETSYGSLLANQMGIEFKNPLFDAQNYNGMGRKEYTNFNPTKGPILKFKDVINNLDVDPIKKEPNGNGILKKVALDYDNYSFAYSDFIGRGESKYALTDAEVFTPFEKRMNKPNLTAQIKAGNTFDFFVMDPMYKFNIPGDENSFKEFLSFKEFDNTNPPYAGPGGYYSEHHFYLNFFKKIQRLKAKGVFLNFYDVNDNPFNRQNFKVEFEKIVNKYQLTSLYTSANYSTDVTDILGSKQIYGFSAFDSLLSPLVNINNKPGISKFKPVRISYNIKGYEPNLSAGYNELGDKNLRFFASKLGVPVVDINNLFMKLKNNSIVIIDGVEVSGKWPGGNFYSNDGENPSAFGQAIITNEIIKVINSFYKTDIPLLNTRDYLIK